MLMAGRSACPWCGGPSNDLGFCQGGCSTAAIFANTCIDCGLDFQTGRFSADQCPACQQKEHARYVRQEAGKEIPRGYMADMIAKGAAHRTYVAQKADERA